jgi:hypothetical protein
MWDDLSPFLVGTGPTATVLDPDGTPNNILDAPQGGSVQVDWSFNGASSGILPLLTFTVALYADPVGPGTNVVAGSATVGPGNPGPNYSVNIPLVTNNPAAPNFLAPDAYRLTTLITTVLGGSSFNIAGFVDGPIIQVRPGP